MSVIATPAADKCLVSLNTSINQSTDRSAMQQDLIDEVEAINAIYGEDTLNQADGVGNYSLFIPSHLVTLRLRFPDSYPDASPEVLGIDSSGHNARKGYGNHVLQLARDVIGKTWKVGEVCLFDLIQELSRVLEAEDAVVVLAASSGTKSATPQEERTSSDDQSHSFVSQDVQLEWAISTPVTEKKSLFLARACSVTSPAHFRSILASLISTDKKIARATHNITAYRIRIPPNPSNPRETVYQDCNDDGETAAGGRLLHLMQTMDVWNVLVVVSRWYGGVKLGPDRFRIINGVARDALVAGGWVAGSKEKQTGGQKKK